MRGTSKVRLQGYDDPLLVAVMKRNGLDEIPLYKHRPKDTNARRDRWFVLGKVRDGAVNPARLRARYCHICVDACPYIHKANGDARKKAGYKTPARFPDDPPESLRK